jgi:carboxyl-terminal processing protease
MKTLKLAACGAATLLVLTGCNTQQLFESRRRVAAPTVPVDAPAATQAALRDYDFAVSSLRALYLKEEKVSTSWQKLADEERKKIINGEPAQFAESMRATVDAIKDDDITIQASGTLSQVFGGIGVTIDLPSEGKERLLVLTVYPDSPADQAGIKPHDSIVAIDGQPVTLEEGPAVLLRVRGVPNSTVTLTVRTPGQQERDVVVTRRVIAASPENTPIVYRLLDNSNIAYIAPNPANPEFMRDEVASALREMAFDQPLDGLVLDLRTMRSNDFPIDAMLSLFVNGDQVGSIQSRSTKTKIAVRGKGVGGSQEVRMAVLVSDLTLGQAEAFAGIVQELGRAKVVGSRTRGHTAVMTRVVLPTSRLEMLIPSGEYLGQKNTSWYGAGIMPNVLLDERWEDYTDADDPVLNRAVEELRK